MMERRTFRRRFIFVLIPFVLAANYLLIIAGSSKEFFYMPIVFEYDNDETDDKDATTYQTKFFMCDERKKTNWEFYNNTSNAMSKINASSILIAQYSAFGGYAKFLELTSPITKAYGKRWNYDVLILQGIALGKREECQRNNGCNENSKLAMHNKIPILYYAFKKNYDHILLLDSDALIVDLDFDIQRLATNNDTLLVAHSVNNSTKTENTWNVNNGVTLWNLKHHMFLFTLRFWLKFTVKDIEKGYFHGDQSYLHRVLKSKNLTMHVRGLLQLFEYRRGTVIKHFVRKNQYVWNNKTLDISRELEIQREVDALCHRFPQDCKTLDKTPYSQM